MDVPLPTARGHPASRTLETDDLDLARRAAADRECFAELYRRHVARVYHYVLVRVRSVQVAQDLTSQIFIAALEGIGSYRGRGAFAAWLFGIAQRQIALHFRGQRRILPLDEAESLPSSDPPFEEAVEESLELARVAKALGTIAPDRAEALALRLFGGLTTAQVSQLTGKSQAAVKMLVYRAVDDLQGRLQLEEER